MKRVADLALISRMSASLDALPDSILGYGASRIMAYPREARRLPALKFLDFDYAALNAQRARRKAINGSVGLAVTEAVSSLDLAGASAPASFWV